MTIFRIRQPVFADAVARELRNRPAGRSTGPGELPSLGAKADMETGTAHRLGEVPARSGNAPGPGAKNLPDGCTAVSASARAVPVSARDSSVRALPFERGAR